MLDVTSALQNFFLFFAETAFFFRPEYRDDDERDEGDENDDADYENIRTREIYHALTR